MSDRCFCFWRGLNKTQKELHEKITMKKRSSATVLKNDSYKRYCKSGMYLQQFNTHASTNHRKATNTMCTVYFDIWLRKYHVDLCQMRNCLIILLHKHGVNLSECLTASGFKMAGISITFIWSLCHHLSGSLAKSFLKIVIYFIRAVEQIFSIYYKIQYTQWNLGLKERKWKHWNTMEVNCIIKENVIIVLF